MYCLRCREHTTTLNETDTTFKNGRPVKKGVCAVCGAKKFQILPGMSRTAGKSLVNSALNVLPMPEMHMRLPKRVLSEDVPGGSFQKRVGTAIVAILPSSISDCQKAIEV